MQNLLQEKLGKNLIKIKKIFIDNFKRHLALNIASMMQSYSNQKYELVLSKYDNKNQVTLIDMEIFSKQAQ